MESSSSQNMTESRDGVPRHRQRRWNGPEGNARLTGSTAAGNFRPSRGRRIDDPEYSFTPDPARVHRDVARAAGLAEDGKHVLAVWSLLPRCPRISSEGTATPWLATSRPDRGRLDCVRVRHRDRAASWANFDTQSDALSPQGDVHRVDRSYGPPCAGTRPRHGKVGAPRLVAADQTAGRRSEPSPVVRGGERGARVGLRCARDSSYWPMARGGSDSSLMDRQGMASRRCV